jgi:hypothetical protein
MKQIYILFAFLISFTVCFTLSSSKVFSKTDKGEILYKSLPDNEDNKEVRILIDSVWWVYVYDSDGGLVRVYSEPND